MSSHYQLDGKEETRDLHDRSIKIVDEPDDDQGQVREAEVLQLSKKIEKQGTRI